MSAGSSPIDVAALFGLSGEEVRGLGIDRDSFEQDEYLEEQPTDFSDESGTLPEEDTSTQNYSAEPRRSSVSAAPLNMGLLAVFMEEAIELLDSLHTALEQLERDASEAAVIEARRSVHTLKGGARMCGLAGVTEISHACEDAIGPAKPGEHSLPEALIALLFQAEQEMREALITPIGPDAGRRLEELVRQLQAAGHAQPGERTGAQIASQNERDLRKARSTLLRRPDISSVAAPSNRLAVDANKVEGIVAKVTEIVANRAASQSLMETLAGTVTESMRTVQRLQFITSQLHYQIVSQGLDVTVEQGLDGLELETYGPIHQLLLQLEEAVGDQQALMQATMDAVTNKRSLAVVETRLDADLQGALLHMRLLPLSQLRVRLDQVVRSAAAAVGREVQWSMEGQHVAMDKQVTDKLFEPLMHLLRNAIDHGIEAPDEREANGKPRVGTLTVRALVEGNQAVIAVSDDGRGMEPTRIAAMAVSRGVLSEAQVSTLSDREKLELIFRPGFSTAEKITELSGRGMGMDIVKESCTRMGGTIGVSSQPGQGTVVTLQVPLSLSVLHALIVHDGGGHWSFLRRRCSLCS